MIGLLLKRFSHLGAGHAEMLENVEVTLLRWLHENQDLVRPEQAPGTLVWRLLAQTGKHWVRKQRYERLALKELGESKQAEWKALGGRFSPPADDAVMTAQTTRVIEELGEPHRSTLLAFVEHKLEDGAPLKERFGLSAAAARKQLSRAREALTRKLRTGKDES
jgi:DNA-directed RNA polymerase specialized sigma24 family protein